MKTAQILMLTLFAMAAFAGNSLLCRLALKRLSIECAVISGAITSGVGYVIWYSALPGLKATSAATVQLSVPVLAAAGGILFLGESITLRFLVSSVAVSQWHRTGRYQTAAARPNSCQIGSK